MVAAIPTRTAKPKLHVRKQKWRKGLSDHLDLNRRPASSRVVRWQLEFRKSEMSITVRIPCSPADTSVVLGGQRPDGLQEVALGIPELIALLLKLLETLRDQGNTR
jgi:hypothetical protein